MKVELTGKEWNAEQQAAALQWYARKHETTVLTDVPITAPNWKGWGAKCPPHVASVALPSGKPGLVQQFDEDIFTAALPAPEPLRPLLPWAGAGRYGLGWLLAYKAYLERSWQPATPVRPAALVSPGEDRPNTASAYEAFDIDIVAVDGEARPKRRGGGSATNDPWENPKPRSEDEILHDLWDQRERAGWWLAEVPIGAGAPRRLDAAVIPWQGSRHSKAGDDVIEEFRAAVADGAPVELIEAKWRPTEEALGQLLGGKHMFSEEYPGHGELSMTACVRECGNEPAQWLYERYPVHIEVVPDGE